MKTVKIFITNTINNLNKKELTLDSKIGYLIDAAIFPLAYLIARIKLRKSLRKCNDALTKDFIISFVVSKKLTALSSYLKGAIAKLFRIEDTGTMIYPCEEGIGECSKNNNGLCLNPYTKNGSLCVNCLTYEIRKEKS